MYNYTYQERKGLYDTITIFDSNGIAAEINGGDP